VTSSGASSLDEILGGYGYPDNSAILITGPAGIGKEALCYWFTESGLEQGDFCLHVTRLPVREVMQDEKAFGVNAKPGKSPFWLASEGGDVKFDLHDLPGLSQSLKEILKKNGDRRIRIVVDALSSLLMLTAPEKGYDFMNELVAETKQYNAVLLATLDEGMHPPQVMAAMQQLFDGFVEFSLHRVGLRITPLLRVGKMRGIQPMPRYFRISFKRRGMVLSRLGPEFGAALGGILPARDAEELDSESGKIPDLIDGSAKGVFGYLVKSFVDDYMRSRLSVDQAGWRTRVSIAEAAALTQMSLYGRDGGYGPVLKELLSKGLVEIRFFPGQRGRGGEVTKIRIAYEKGVVKRLVSNYLGSTTKHH
jgi:KaiC/GvpD/RAD55 family RecA-like ATPase